MRLTFAVFTAALLVSSSALAQTQQAGSEAATNAEETFKKLVAKCDDVDALVLRARVRLAMGRLDDQAAVEELTKKTDAGLALCGEGKIDEAKASLTETLAAADAKVSEKFGQEGDTNEVKAAQSDAGGSSKGSSAGRPEASIAATQGSEAKMATEEKTPWWKFW
ncbi:MAG: hypothetical protein AAF346_06585 [Pseudomonadota bacterium]